MGMGPRLLKFKPKGGETLYSLKAIPFGGSCLMDEDEEAGGDPRAFNNQKPWKRFCILFAGALVNLVCGVLIMGVLVGMSSTMLTTKVRGFVSEEASTLAQGLQTGDTITKVNGRRIYSFMDLEYLVSRANGKVDLTVRRGKERVKFPGFQFPMEETEGIQRIQFDFTPVYYSNNPEYKNASGPLTFGLRVKDTLQESVSAVRMVWLSLLDMVTGKFHLRDISGPIGVVSILTDTAQEAQQGAASENKAAARGALLMLLNLFALISINIGVMNLLPLPALDGGRLVFTGIEVVFRKPVPKKFEGWVHAAGFALLMVFMLIVTFSDIWGLVKK
jgi:regulator of sigma E protease